jgi:hypothetical protein
MNISVYLNAFLSFLLDYFSFVFLIMALSVNPDMIHEQSSTQDVSTAETFNQNYTDASGLEDSGFSEVGKVYEDPNTGELVMVLD